MLKDYPYSLLKQEKQSYEILLLRDQHGNTFSDIARVCELPAARVAQKYYQIKMKQIRLYINHILAVLGHENTSRVKKIYYEWFYHKQVVALIMELEQNAENQEEKTALWNYYFKVYRTSKERYTALTKGQGQHPTAL